MSKHFTVDARTILALGRDSIRDQTTAVLELVKNGYDAGASIVSVTIDNPCDEYPGGRIRVSDNGTGMTDDDVEKKWLRIGYSEKRSKKKSGKRRRVGEKGIGRLSADRLGSKLSIQSQARNKPPVGLLVDWQLFEVPGKNIEKIPIKVIPDVRFPVPLPPSRGNKAIGKINSRSCTGTELLITKIRESWAEEDIEDLHRELSILTPPFRKTLDFKIRLMTNVTEAWNGIVKSPFHHAAQVKASFSLDPKSKTVKSSFTYPKNKKKKGKHFITNWSEFIHTKEPNGIEIGAVSTDFYYFLRAAKSVKDLDITLTELREFLNNQAGVRVYRDLIRVVPYGDMKKSEGGDWLGLGDRKSRSPAGAARRDFRIAANQLVGAVYLTRDGNPGLVDTSGREGLIHGKNFNQLKQFLMGCVISLENEYRELFKEEKKTNETKIEPRKIIQEFSNELQELRKGLSELETEIPASAKKKLEFVSDQIETAFASASEVERSIEELASQATTYRGIASIGIAAATFGHETEASLTQFRTSIIAAKNILESEGDEDEAFEEIEKALFAAERVSAWGQFAIRRIKPDKRRKRKQDISKIVAPLVKELQPIFEASNIDLAARIQSIDGRFFPMDIESVVLNFLTNAYFFCKLTKRKRQVLISVKRMKRDGMSGVEIAVSDTGPGVPKTRKNVVWDALYSSKLDPKGKQMGTGLGLSIVDDIVREADGERNVTSDEELKGARFAAWLPIKK